MKAHENPQKSESCLKKIYIELHELVTSPLCLYIIILCLLLIIFSFFAPLLLTLPNNYFNFNNTGSIGDTIGGIMNPFIALAGVLMTFIAFYIQYRANQEQRKQFIRTLEKSYIDEKIKCFYKLELLDVDLQSIKKDIKNRIKALDEFMDSLNTHAFKRTVLKRTPDQLYQRLCNEDRLELFKAFKTFIPTDHDYRIEFNNYFTNIYYISESLKSLYSITDKHVEEVYKIKSNIRKLSLNISLNYERYRNNKTDNKLDAILDTYIAQYNELATFDNKESDYEKVFELVNTLLLNLSSFPVETLQENVKSIYNDAIQISLSFNDIQHMNALLLVELNTIKSNIYSQEISSYRVIDNFHILIEKILDNNSIEKIKENI